MSVALKKSIIDHLESHVTAVGFAPTDRFKDAPEKHHPTNACKDAQTVIVFGITMPQGMLHSPDYNLHFLHRTYHTVYMHLDELGLDLCNFIESQGDYFAVPIPSFAPLVYHDLEPWGIISLKHAIYPIALKDEQGLKNIERIINTAGYNYWLKCDECLKVCPNNQPKGS